jgi:hypothetical protein
MSPKRHVEAGILDITLMDVGLEFAATGRNVIVLTAAGSLAA